MKNFLIAVAVTFFTLLPGNFVRAQATYECTEATTGIAAGESGVTKTACLGTLDLRSVALVTQSSTIESIKNLDYNAGQDAQQLRQEAEMLIATGNTAFQQATATTDPNEKIRYFNAAGENYAAAVAKFDKASKYLPLTKRNYDPIYTDNNLVMRAGDNFSGNNAQRLRDMFSWENGRLLRTVNRMLGGIGIVYFLILGFKFLLSQGNDEKISSYKTQFGWIIVGLVVISLAEFIGFRVIDPAQRDIITGTGADSATQNFYDKAKQVVRFFEYIVGGLMLINGLMSGYNLIMRGQKEEAISQEKRFFQSFLVGSIFILMAEVFVRIFSMQDGITNTRYLFITEVAGLVNYLLSFIAIVATIMLIFSSLYYIISFGNEDQMNRAKRILYANVLGVVIAFSAYTIARFLINT